MCQMDYEDPFQLPNEATGSATPTPSPTPSGGTVLAAAFNVPPGLDWRGSREGWARLTLAVRRNCSNSEAVCPQLPKTCLMCGVLQDQARLDALALFYDELAEKYYCKREFSYEGGAGFEVTTAGERADGVEAARRVIREGGTS